MDAINPTFELIDLKRHSLNTGWGMMSVPKRLPVRVQQISLETNPRIDIEEPCVGKQNPK